MNNPLPAVSGALTGAVREAGRLVVAVDARHRFPSSGVLWRPGVVVTAEHAIKREQEITVTLPDGRSLPARLAGRDAGTDLAALKLEEAAGPDVQFGGSDALEPGNLVLAIGRSPESGVLATMGILSAVGGAWRTWRGGRIDRYVRLDLTLYPGCSGAAVIDAEGRLLGLATSALSRLAAVAIPVATVNRVLDDLLAKGRVSRGYLGVALQPVAIPDHLRKQQDLPGATGLIVLSVQPDGPAARAGILVGDILAALGGAPTQDTDDVQGALEGRAVGTAATALVLRGGVRHETSVTVAERPSEAE